MPARRASASVPSADSHTRSVLLRGGSNYRPSASGWYLPQTLRGSRSIAPTLNEHQKYFLFDNRYERAGTVGFRCAADPSAAELASSAADACGPGAAAPCGTFDAPNAFTTLSGGVKDWATYGLAARMAGGGARIVCSLL